MPELPMGANTSLGSRHGDVVIRHALDPALDVNLTAFLVGPDGRVRSDADMIFFNQPEAEGGCARYHAPRIAGTTVEHRLSFDLARLPDGIEKIVVALTEDQGPGFAAIRDLIAHTGDVQLSPVPTFTRREGPDGRRGLRARRPGQGALDLAGLQLRPPRSRHRAWGRGRRADDRNRR